LAAPTFDTAPTRQDFAPASKTGLRSHGLLPGRVTPHLPMPVRVIRLQGVSHTRCVSPSPQPASPEQRLIIISGEEGAGKSTIVRALLPSTPHGARIDAEDIGQTNPCPMDDTFFDLLRRNVAGLVENFWAAGYVNVIAGSFLRRYSDYVSFRQLLRPSTVFLIDLLVDKDVRDHRRITRAKRTTQEWRDMVDQIPEDRTIRRATDATDTSALKPPT
jgi:hypothetical protein